MTASPPTLQARPTPPTRHGQPARGPRRHLLRTVVVLGAVGLAVASVPLAAYRADAAGSPATSSAQALSGTTALSGSVSTSTAAASSDGTAASDSGLLQAGVGTGGTGVAMQRARATAAGSVSACAAVLGSGGTLQLNADGTCTTSAGGSTVSIPLTSLVSLKVRSVVASCSVAAPGGAAASSVSLAGASVEIAAIGLVPAVSLPLTASAGGSVTLPAGLGTVAIDDEASTNGSDTRAGSARATALRVRVLGSSTADVVLAKVDCGVPTFLLPAVPGSAGLVLVPAVGAVAWAARRWWWAPTRALLLPAGAP